MKVRRFAVLVILVLGLFTTALHADTVNSQIANLYSSHFTIQTGQGFAVSSTTQVTYDGAKYAYTSLKPGMTVAVEYAACGMKLPCASRISATSTSTSTSTKESTTVDGSIKELYSSHFLLSTGQTFVVTSSTRVYYNGSATSYGNLKTGMLASVSPVDCGSKYPCAAQIMAKDCCTTTIKKR